MSGAITCEIIGVPELARALQAIPAQLSSRVLKEALHAAGEVIHVAAEGMAPVRSGELKASIITKVHVDPALINNYVIIGPGYDRGTLTVKGLRRNRRGGFELAVDSTESPGVYGKFVEMGHREGHRSGKEIEYGGEVAAHPWLRPAFEGSKDEAMAVLRAAIAIGLNAVVLAVRSPVTAP